MERIVSGSALCPAVVDAGDSVVPADASVLRMRMQKRDAPYFSSRTTPIQQKFADIPLHRGSVNNEVVQEGRRQMSGQCGLPRDDAPSRVLVLVNESLRSDEF